MRNGPCADGVIPQQMTSLGANSVIVKNLLTVLSSRVGGLGSTRPAATEDKVADKRAEETRS